MSEFDKYQHTQDSAPISSGDSFSVLPSTRDKVSGTLGTLSETERQLREIKRGKYLSNLVSEMLKHRYNGYRFADYEDRLLLSDVELLGELENRHFQMPGKMEEIGIAFRECLDSLPDSTKPESVAAKKLEWFRSLNMADLILEQERISSNSATKEEARVKFTNKTQFRYDCRLAGASGCRILNVVSAKLPVKLDVPDFLGTIEASGYAGIRSLKLENNDFHKKTKGSDFVNIVGIAWRSGIRSIDFRRNSLFRVAEAHDFFTIASTAGQSGIRNLNLGGNGLYKAMGFSDFLQLVHIAGESGIRSLGLAGNRLHDKLRHEDVLELVRNAGCSGIRSLDLRFNSLFEDCRAQDILQIVEVAGKFGIRSLYLGESVPVEKLSVADFHKYDVLIRSYHMNLYI